MPDRKISKPSLGKAFWSVLSAIVAVQLSPGDAAAAPADQSSASQPAVTTTRQVALTNELSGKDYIEHGRLLLANGNYEQAAAEFEAARLAFYRERRQPPPEIHSLLAEALLRSGRPAQALAVLEKPLAEQTNDAAAKELYVLALRACGLDGTVAETAAKFWPEPRTMPTTVRQALAKSYLVLGQPQLALPLYQSLAAERPQDNTLKLDLAYALLFANNTIAGLNLYGRLLSENTALADKAADDAEALAAQGNLVAARGLYERLLAIHPKNTQYRTRYAALLLANNLPQAAERVATSEPATAPEQAKQLHQAAIAAARCGDYPTALATLRWLASRTPDDATILGDYITVLVWAGNYHAAIAQYENLPAARWPDYVRRAASQAYAAISNYRAAIMALEPLSAAGDRSAMLRQAELWGDLGEMVEAYRLYDRLLANNPRDVDALASRAAYAAKAGDYPQAIADYRAALALLPSNAAETMAIRARLASAYLNLRLPYPALALLKPYIVNGTATLAMQGDYIVALTDTKRYQLAVYEVERLWPDYRQVPAYALRILAENYIRLRQTVKAVKIYEELASRQGAPVSDRLRVGYGLLLEGKLFAGLAIYGQVLDHDPAAATLAANDAASLLAADHYAPGRALFDLIIRRYPQNHSIRRQYADYLARAYLYRAAYEQYAILAQHDDWALAGLSGMLRTALAIGDNRLAADAYLTLKAKFGQSKAVAAITAEYTNRATRDVWSGYTASASHKKLASQSGYVSARQELDGRLRLTAGYDYTRLADHDANQTQLLHGRSVGLEYTAANTAAALLVGQTDAASLNTYRLKAERTVTDQLSYSLQISRRPVLDVQALRLPGGAVMATAYAISVEYSPSSRERRSLSAERTYFSDSNRAFALAADDTYTIFDRGQTSLQRTAYWRRAWFSEQDQVYESPSLREALGVTWQLRRNFATGATTWYLMANWDHDSPDPLAFNPALRLEYTKYFAANHAFTLGGEYGLRTQDWLGYGKWRYSYRQLDFAYRRSW